ncbi:MAG: SGNH/GDSL hydrolase family protein [Lacisediminihabitans sp.]
MPLIVTLFACATAALAAAFFIARRLVLRRRRAAVIRLTADIPVNAKWWHQQEHKTGELLYVAVGDSAAQGIGASRPGRSYVGMLATHLRQRTGRPVRVVNLGQSGARLREALTSQLPKLRQLHPDVLTVSIGANDVADFDAERFEHELRELYSALPQHAIVADLPAFYFGAPEKNVQIANGILHRVAGELALEVAPLYAATRRQSGLRYALNQVAADFFHPNDRGYRVWASAFIPLLDRRVPATPSTETGE